MYPPPKAAMAVVDKAPETLDAICAELLNNVLAVITSLAATLVEKEADAAVNDPDISEANCAELENNVLAVITSFAATLVLKDALAAVKDPDMSEAI